MLPLSVLPVFAASKVESGQTKINLREDYGIKNNKIYSDSGEIPKYNKEHADTEKNYAPTGKTDLLKKYITNYPSDGGDNIEPAFEDVPIYRVSRRGGYTNKDTHAVVTNIIDPNNIGSFVSAANKDYYAAGRENVLNQGKAKFIAKVLNYGFKQFTTRSGAEYRRQQLYFLATQCLIWEISEGKREGWGNEKANSDTRSENYPTNAGNRERSSEIRNSYNPDMSKKAKYYWHDFYYTVYNTMFASCPDYYDEILKACAMDGVKPTYTINGKSNAFSKENNINYDEMTYNNKTGKYELRFTVDEKFIGSAFGKYNPQWMALPVYNTEKGIEGMYEDTYLPKGTKIHSNPTTDSKVWEAASFRYHVHVRARTLNGWYYVRYQLSDGWHYGYVKASQAENPNIYSQFHLSVSGNEFILSSSKPIPKGAYQKYIQWDKTVPEIYNNAAYFSGDGETKSGIRGYISGGSAARQRVFLGMSTPNYNVTFKNNINNQSFNKTFPKGYIIKENDIPEFDVNNTEYSFVDWSKGIMSLNTPAGEEVTSDTVYTKNYKKNSKTVTFIDKTDMSVIAAKTANYGQKITVPNTPVHSGYKFKYWSNGSVEQDIQSGKSYLIDNMAYYYFAEYEGLYTVTYKCRETGETLATFTGTSGTKYTVPQVKDKPDGNYVDKNTGMTYPYADLNIKFAGFNTEDNRKLETGKEDTITKDETVWVEYYLYSDVTINAYGLDYADASEWKSSIHNGSKGQNYVVYSEELVKENSEYKYTKRDFKDILTGETDTSIVAPNGYYISKVKVSNGKDDLEIIPDIDTRKEYTVTSNLYPFSPSQIEIYFEKVDTLKNINIHYMTVTDECDFNSPTAKLVEKRQTSLSYGTKINFKQGTITMESGTVVPYYEPMVVDNEVIYKYTGEYGYITSSGEYNHINSDKTAEFAELSNYYLYSDIDIYLYYKQTGKGGLNVNIWATPEATDGLDFTKNNTTVKIYTSDESIDKNQVFTGNAEDKVLNDKLTLFKDLTSALIPTENTDSLEFLPEQYPYAASVKLKPEELVSGKYYYIVVNDNIYDHFYFDPEVSGGIIWNGCETTYDIVVDTGPYRQDIKIISNRLPAWNAKVLYMNETAYQMTALSGGLKLILLEIQFQKGQITKEEYDKGVKDAFTPTWQCPDCGNLVEGSSTCPKCGAIGDTALGYVFTDEDGCASFYTDEPNYKFTIMDEYYKTGISDSSIAKPSWYNHKQVDIYKYNKDNTKTLISSNSGANTTNELSGFCSALENETTAKTITGSQNLTVCTLTNVFEDITINVYSNEDLTNTDVDFSSYEEIEDRDRLLIYNNLYTDLVNNKGEFIIDEAVGLSGEQSYTNKLTFNYNPNITATLALELALNNPNQKLKLIEPLASGIKYMGDRLTFNFVAVPDDGSPPSESDMKPTMYIGFNDIPTTDASFINDIYLPKFTVYADKYSLNKPYLFVEQKIPDGIINEFNEKLAVADPLEYVSVSKSYMAGRNKKAKYTVTLERAENQKQYNIGQGWGLIKGTPFNPQTTKTPSQANYRITITLDNETKLKDKYHFELKYNEHPENELYSLAKTNYISTSYSISNSDKKTISILPVENSKPFIGDAKNACGFKMAGFDEMKTGIVTNIVDERTNKVLDKSYFVSRSDVHADKGDFGWTDYEQQLDIFRDINSTLAGEYSYYTVEYYPTKNMHGHWDCDSSPEYIWDDSFLTMSPILIQNTYERKLGSIKDKKTNRSVENVYRSIADEPITDLYLNHTASIYSDELNKYDFDGYVIIKLHKDKPQSNSDFDVSFIQPNADYKFDTTVVSSFMVNNNTATAYTDSNPLSVAFDTDLIYKVNNREAKLPLYAGNKQLVLPSNLNNITYCRWTVPSKDELLEKIALKEGVRQSEIELLRFNVTAVVSDTKTSYSKKDTGVVTIATEFNSTVPKSGYDLHGGDHFIYTKPTADKEYHNIGQWQEYVCENGNFKLLNNTARLDYTSNLLRPDELTPTKEVKPDENGNYKWFTRSGYSVRTEVHTKASVLSENGNIVSQSSTPAQTAEVYYPEFNYIRENAKAEPLVHDKSNNIFIFKDVQNASTTKSRHYIPVWFPDADYQTQTLVSDMWTPAGMLSYLGISNPIGIRGSLFDDYKTQQLA